MCVRAFNIWLGCAGLGRGLDRYAYLDRLTKSNQSIFMENKIIVWPIMVSAPRLKIKTNDWKIHIRTQHRQSGAPYCRVDLWVSFLKNSLKYSSGGGLVPFSAGAIVVVAFRLMYLYTCHSHFFFTCWLTSSRMNISIAVFLKRYQHCSVFITPNTFLVFCHWPWPP